MRDVSLKRILATLALLALAACNANGGSSTTFKPGDQIQVVTTFSTLNSFVNAVGGPYVHVQNLVPIGASPEDYQPTPQDIATLADSQVLVMNGAGIEAWLTRTLADAKNPDLKVVVCTDGLPVKIGNPHLWMNPDYAKVYVQKIRDTLIAVDPTHKAAYISNANRYDGVLEALADSIAQKIGTIPADQRNMIVFHNAWDYYDARFGLHTIGAIESSPGQEPNPQRIAQLVDLAKQYHVRAMFAEPEYSPKLVQSLAQSAGVKVVTDLYDDSIGADPRVHDYTSMLTYDTDTIVKALK
ncbi:MAG TPA: metal ABC transporter substrate-binding protein [Verrucomicrobiae bacterium]|nr:metal ABC transporter substrate-binding protein [Verrucomicrobiae bacterium]